jgi:hypothetical protein
MFINYLCECMHALNSPSTQEVLRSIHANTVCTGTQCFESYADALGVHTDGVHPTESADFPHAFALVVTVLMAAAGYLRLKTRVNDSLKPWVKHDGGPPPPPPDAPVQ